MQFFKVMSDQNLKKDKTKIALYVVCCQWKRSFLNTTALAFGKNFGLVGASVIDSIINLARNNVMNSVNNWQNIRPIYHN